jgi:hypothetical protein
VFQFVVIESLGRVQHDPGALNVLGRDRQRSTPPNQLELANPTELENHGLRSHRTASITFRFHPAKR